VVPGSRATVVLARHSVAWSSVPNIEPCLQRAVEPTSEPVVGGTFRRRHRCLTAPRRTFSPAAPALTCLWAGTTGGPRQTDRSASMSPSRPARRTATPPSSFHLQLGDDRFAQSVPPVRILQRVQLIKSVPGPRLSCEVPAVRCRPRMLTTPVVEEVGEDIEAIDRDPRPATEATTSSLNEFAKGTLRGKLHRGEGARAGDRWNLVAPPSSARQGTAVFAHNPSSFRVGNWNRTGGGHASAAKTTSPRCRSALVAGRWRASFGRVVLGGGRPLLCSL
jgi:hypothetical protein